MSETRSIARRLPQVGGVVFVPTCSEHGTQGPERSRRAAQSTPTTSYCERCQAEQASEQHETAPVDALVEPSDEFPVGSLVRTTKRDNRTWTVVSVETQIEDTKKFAEGTRVYTLTWSTRDGSRTLRKRVAETDLVAYVPKRAAK